MITLLRALCVTCCILTGIYYLILFRLDKGVRRTLWFPVLCFTLGISMFFSLAYHPVGIYDMPEALSLKDNLFLITFILSSLAMNMYNGLTIAEDKNRFFMTFNIICVISAMLCLVVSGKAVIYVYFLALLLCFIAYLYGLYASFKMFNTSSKLFVFSLVSYLLFLAALIPDVVFMLYRINVLSIRAVIIPVYLVLHVLMLTLQYRESLRKTQELSAALSETIEKIGHSDNALKCTQMKPDFLYETLDLISSRCETDPFTAEDLTISLSKYLRHTLNFQQLKGIVPLSNELELTKAYIAIEREQYRHVAFEYRFPEEIPEVYVPPLSIQPLVENALEHGFGDKRVKGKITVSIMPYRDYCTIDVSDDGKGIPEEMLAGLPASFAQTARIGLYNIHKRLTEKFGNGLVIQSAEGVGTSISFTVPPEGKYSELKEEIRQ